MTTTLPAHLIGPHDTLARCRTVCPANGAHFTHEELHALLECATTEVIFIGDGLQLIVDGDGKRSGALNRVATALARHVLPPSDSIVGPAIVCETAALPRRAITSRKRALRQAPWSQPTPANPSMHFGCHHDHLPNTESRPRITESQGNQAPGAQFNLGRRSRG